ncbi:Leucine-rich repeat-containing protein 9 [Nowakowskiella sp. JEL0407]|nr:Leucine-rich repeat-containing protein 9 [Nowakowskiella sp. JEL0407]
MCHFNYPKITGLSYFKYLKSLTIIAQDIAEIENLDTCVCLEQLWICETKVHCIKGLECCLNLKQLYLYSNRISKIEGLDLLIQLETLWLNDNAISHISGVKTLKNLKQLHLGNNRISIIGNSLNHNITLRELNIAGNKLSSFRDILHLSRLKNLTTLNLSDPNFADNPICLLCNYQTHVIYHLSGLKYLDTLDVTDESRKIISATVLKKRMYYNMRIRTIKRNTNFLLKILKSKYNAEEEQLEAELISIFQRLKYLEKQKDDLDILKDCNNNNGKEKLVDIITSLETLTHESESKSHSLTNLHIHKTNIIHQIMEQSDMAIRKLLLELETGGNVRFEDEQREDHWFEKCETLVKNFILRASHTPVQKRIQIHRISRIHNRYIRNKFEAKLQKKPDSTKSFEYLCFHGSKDHSECIFSVIESGFKSSSNEGGRKGYVLSNFLECADDEKEDLLHQQQHRHDKRLRQAVIVKAYTCSSTTQEEAKDNKNSATESEVSSNTCKSFDSFDGDLVLPEFFLEYSLESNLDRLTTKMEKLMIDIAYSNKLSQADMPAIISEICSRIKDDKEVNKKVDSDLSIPLFKNSEHQDKELELLTSKIIQSAKSLNLTKNLTILTKLDNLPLPQLSNLNLSLNNMKTYEKLHAHFPNLSKLDLSFNKFTSVPQCISELKVLTELNLMGNLLRELEGVEKRYSLEVLDLRFNQITKRKRYRVFLIRILPNLTILDSCHVHPSERDEHPTSNELWTKIISERVSSQSHIFRPLSVRTQVGHGSFASEHEYKMDSEDFHVGSMIPPSHITTLELDSCGLFSLDMVPTTMVNLRWASFRNNNLRDITALTKFTKIEELSLENNEIEHIECLAHLPFLAKLDVSNNCISNLKLTHNFRSLMHLSLENNLVKSLRPFSKIASLMEFYIGNNEIKDLFSIFPLKELSRLIILDLTGNALCHEFNYRLFTIFHLSKLKILDGTGINIKEQTSAKEAYLGKLTVELLGEKIGHFSFKNISELDLRNCKIKEIDCFSTGEFRHLRKLNFDNNQLTGLDAFIGLVGLKCLSLNNNRIERLASFDLGGCGVSSVSGSDGVIDSKGFCKLNLPQLEELYLGYNNISKISELGLYRLPTLKLLYLNGNKILKIDGLEYMSGLVELVLDKNLIKSAEPTSFVSMINLKELHIKENRIKTLSHFDCLPNLLYLYLANNRVHDTVEIEKMKLPNLLELSLSANAVARKQMYRYAIIVRFPQIMVIDGKDVVEDERVRAEQAYYLDQSFRNEDPSIKLMNSSQSLNQSLTNANVKLPIKIASVVLDGLEMKLAHKD